MDESTIDMIFQRFLALIEEAYFAEDSDVQAMVGSIHENKVALCALYASNIHQLF